MDITIPVPKFRDRRIAASNEYLDGSERGERRLHELALSGATTPRERRQAEAEAHGSARWIYGSGSGARRASRRRVGTFDITRVDFDRPPESITTIILHSTSGNPFTADDLPPRDADETRGNYHRTNEIIAHFLVLRDGTIVYTHDVQYWLNDAGGRAGIDIEFCGRFSTRPRPPSDLTRRLTVDAILAGRLLVASLTAQIPSITRIHPHGQVQRRDRQGQCGGVGTRNVCGKLVSCPGPDVWMNVGEWATGPALNMVSKETLAGYPNNYRGQDFAQFNPRYDQGVR